MNPKPKLLSAAKPERGGHHRGVIVEITEDRVIVDFEGNLEGPLEAEPTMTFETHRAWASPGTEVLLVFEGARADRPVIIDILPDKTKRTPSVVTPSSVRPIHADDGRVRIQAEDELVMGCGQSGIALRRNGRLVVYGTYIETCARGVNWVRGGRVKVN